MSFLAKSTVLTFLALNSAPMVLSFFASLSSSFSDLRKQRAVLLEKLFGDGFDAEGFFDLASVGSFFVSWSKSRNRVCAV